ncbi:MAG: dipeptidase PepV [Eubacterium sp.]|nr:dipeptidase PepV [Eubacterium sp.]
MDLDLTSITKAVRPQAVETLKELIRINSEGGDPVTAGTGERFPYGQGVQDSFAYMLSKAEELGFRTEDVDHVGGHVEFGEGDEILGILGHLDVVPAAGEWAYGPYDADEIDGYIYGRGTTDDKGPVVAVLYAMKALRDAGYEPDRRVRLILGLDEETGKGGMRRYLEEAGAPDFGFTPDGDFPVINGEKGRLEFELARKFAGGLPAAQNAGEFALRHLSGGMAPNIVPDRARAVILHKDSKAYDEVRSLLAQYREDTGYRLRCKRVGKSLEIVAEGTACHGARPENGVNAIAVLMGFLGRLQFAGDDLQDFIEFYNEHVAFDPFGEKLGIGFCDEPSGKLSVNNGIIFYDRNSIRIRMDVRFPVTSSAEQVYEAMQPLLDSQGIGVMRLKQDNPLFIPEEMPMIQTLLEVYRDHSGDTEAGPLVIGGGTYAKSTPNVVAFGALFPGDEDRMHQPNERIAIERFYQLIDIYADAIYRLTQKDFHYEEHES